jgi:uncharacterized protein involved in exopolysaccharide biosynthesis/Mg-chelatase subunit ChlD
MNPDQPSRDQIETRISALLLGELPADEAALLRYTIARDPALQKLHDELQSTLVLVREASKTPADAPVEKGAPLKLSAERRQKLLAHFKTPRAKQTPEPLFWLKRIQMPSTLVVSALIILFVLGIAAISIPNFVKARSTSQANAVINNLRQIDAAKNEWALENKKSGNDVPTFNDLSPYLKGIPQPVMGEKYTLGKVSEPVVADVKTSQSRGQYGGTGATLSGGSGNQLERLDSDGKLTFRTASGEITERESVQVATASATPSAATPSEPVTLAPEPKLPPPPAASPVQIVLPKAEPAPEMSAQPAAPADAGVYSQRIVGYVNVPVPAGGATVTVSSEPASGSTPLPAETGAGQLANSSPAGPLPAASATSADQFPAITPNGISADRANEQQLFKVPAIELPKAEPPKMAEPPKIVSADQFATSGLQPGGGSTADKKFYRSLAPQPAKSATPLLGAIPMAGNLSQPAAQAVVYTPLRSSRAVAVAAETASADANDSTKTPQSISGLPPGDRKDFVGRYAYIVTNAVAPFDQLQTPNALAVNGSPQNIFNPGTTPTMDEQQLQAVNQQRVEGEKIYSEQLVQLQELKSIERTNKDKLAEVLPQMFQDTALNDMLSKRREANQSLAVLTNDYAATSLPVARAQTSIDELNHEIDARIGGIMVGLESQVNSKKAELDGMTTSVEKAQQKEQEDASKNQPYYDAKRDLEQKMEMHKLLYSKLESEKLNLFLPINSLVQITDPAQPGKSQNTWQRLTGQVESKARIKVESDDTDIPGMSSPTVAYGGYNPYFVQTTFEIMRSEPVLGKVVDALNLESAWAKKNGGEKLTKSEAIAQLKQQLDLHSVPNTSLIEIGAKSSDPQEAANIANAVAKAYAEYRFEARRQLTTNGIAVLEDQFTQQEEDIRTAQAKVESLGKQLTPEAPEQTDLPLHKPAPNAPLPQPEILTRENAFSTFSLNVSDVSFKFAEASLQNGKLPDTASIRSEEFINAFDYRDPEAAAGQAMAFTSERARYPFAHNRDLLRFSIKTAAAGRPAGRALNLVLLLDNSGSMERADRVEIIREALRVLATQLQPQDTVSVVTFARTARLWADGVRGDQAGETLNKVGGITPEGGTNLEEAMRLAYETARRHYLANGMNRVVLLTDGAANLGNVDPAALKQKVEAQRKQGIALDCFGIGWEDYNDDLLEQLSSNGDGRYAFLNSPEDAAKDFATKLAGALQVAAEGVKVQVEFNPRRVISYRQIGYATHQLAKEQFRDNTVAAGEIAAQEAGNALYTIETNPNGDGPIATVHVRYQIPGTTDYREHSWDVIYTGTAPTLDQSSPAMRLAATASAFSEWLAASPFAQEVTLDELLKNLSGVPEIYGADDRPKQLETMIREAKSLEGK